MALHLNSYMYDSDTNEKYQSAYIQFHSTETALVCVANHMCRCADEKKAALLVLLTVSAAFDTVDDNILLDHMVKQLGNQDTSLS